MALILESYGAGMYGIRATHFSKALMHVGRTVPGMAYVEGVWRGYADAVMVAKRLLEQQGLRINVVNPLPAPRDEQTITGALIAYKGLRDYQKQATAFLVTHGEEGCLLADEMGLGKTACALRAARALKKPTLVVCPSFARGIWGDNPSSQVKDWWPEAWPPRVLTGVQPEKSGLLKREDVRDTPTYYLPEALLTVAHYDILHAWAPYLAGVTDTLILDEARFIQSEKSRRSLAVRVIAEHARYRFGLDGTPVANHVSQLWNVIDTLCPGRMGKPFSFYLRYAGAHQEAVTLTKTVWKFDGLTNEEELHDRLEYFLLRRTMTDVKMQLPPRTRQVLEFDVEAKFCMGPDVALRSDVNMRRALDLASDGKLPQAIETICAHLRSGRTLVAFTHRQAVCEAICLAGRTEGFRAEFLHGGVSQKERIRRYESCPQLLVANMDCVAGGIDLSYADTSFFVELDYDPQKVVQCSRRVYRFKQQRPVLEQFAVGRGTVDELIRDRMIKKLDMFQSVVGKMDDKLREDLDKSSAETSLADMRRFWESIKGD